MNSNTSDNKANINKGSATSTLGLKIPAQKNPPNDHVLLDSKKTIEWFSSLPVANIGETARQVYLTLVDFNRFDISDIARVKAVEQFRTPAEYVINNLLKRYVDMGFPLSNKNWKVTLLARELCSEVTIAYKIIVERMLNGENPNFDRKLLIISIHRSLHYLKRQITLSTLSYTPWPIGTWKEVNSLYAYAYQNGVHQMPVRIGGKNKSKAATTIQEVFFAISLLAAASPHKLKQSQISQLEPYLLIWAKRCTAEEYIDETDPSGQFIIDLWKDMPPLHAALNKGSLNAKQLVLDTRELSLLLKNDIDPQSKEKTGITKGLRIDLVQHLLLAWNSPPKRKSERRTLNFELQVIAGFSALHDYLFDPQKLSIEIIRKKDKPEAKPTKRKLMKQTNDFDGLGGGLSLSTDDDSTSYGALSGQKDNSTSRMDSLLGGLSINLEGDQPEEIIAFGETQHTTHEAFNSDQKAAAIVRVKTHNESDDGYCIAWLGDSIPKLKITDIIGIKSAHDEDDFAIAAVRWIKYSAQDTLDIGVQLLASHCTMAEISTIEERENGIDLVQKCLLLHNNKNDEQIGIKQLLTLGDRYTVGSVFALVNNNHLHNIKITKILESNQGFHHCEYRELEPQPEKEEPEAKETVDSETDFSDLWQNI